MTPPVVLGAPGDASRLADICDRARVIGENIEQALDFAAELGAVAPDPGDGSTLQRWQTLAGLGAADLTVARVVEPHLDALAILDEADRQGIEVALDAVRADAASTWGVFAAEGPGVRLTATLDGNGWRLSGVKPWCSLADRLSHALVTAHTESGRALFAISLRGNDIDTDPSAWVARGLSHVTSGPITMRGVPAVPVGPAQWYLERPGFAWGGIGVAAVWYGGAVGLARALAAATKTDEPIRLMHLGAVDSALFATSVVLAESAATIDRGGMDGAAASLLAARVRAVAADAAELVLTRVGHALGPAPLALDAQHARRVADLQLYLRQHHAERDQAALGALIVKTDQPPW